MLNFFRKIRWQLANENKFLKYFRYAFGEVVLIMLGIFMALQLQNWNENRKQESQFKTSLEHVYNTIDIDIANFKQSVYYTIEQHKLLNSLLNNPDSIPNNKLLNVLYYLDTKPSLVKNSQSTYYFSKLNPDPKNITHNTLAQEISSYTNWSYELNLESDQNLITNFLIQNNFPRYYPVFGYTATGNFTSNLFFQKENERVRALLDSVAFKDILRSVQNYKRYIVFSINGTGEDGESIKNKIEKYYPEVRLLYQDIGIIGDATNNWTNSIPMMLIDEQKSIWKIEITLKNGSLKFRSRDSWIQNWGGDTFPKGNALYFGENILIKAGKYRVILDLSENTYEFIPIE